MFTINVKKLEGKNTFSISTQIYNDSYYTSKGKSVCI